MDKDISQAFSSPPVFSPEEILRALQPDASAVKGLREAMLSRARHIVEHRSESPAFRAATELIKRLMLLEKRSSETEEGPGGTGRRARGPEPLWNVELPVVLLYSNVVPALPIEHQPVEIWCYFWNNSQREVTGTVTSSWGGEHRIERLQPGESVDFAVNGTAPVAAAKALLQVFFLEDGGAPRPAGIIGAITYAPLGRAGVIGTSRYADESWSLVDVAARYFFSIDSIRIEETRSPSEDSLTLSLAFWVYDLPNYWGFLTRSDGHVRFPLGDRSEGTHVLGLRQGPIDVVPTDNVELYYAILNGPSALKRWLQDNAAAPSDYPHESDPGYLLAPASFLLTFFFISPGLADLSLIRLLPSCDGFVTFEDIRLSGAELDQKTSMNGFFQEERHYAGGDSPTGCGSNSSYNVTFSVTRESFVPLP